LPKPIQLHDHEGNPIDASELVARGAAARHFRALADQDEGRKILAEFAMEHIANQVPEGPQQPLGQQVEVVDLLPSWMFGGGWADGPFTHHPGARLYLDYQVGGRVYYQGYVRDGILGWFRSDQMGKVRRLPERLQTERDYHTALAALSRVFALARTGTPEGDEYERLAALLTDYEARHGLDREADLRPGSPAARAAGCACPVADNEDLLGAGKTRAEDPYVAVPRCPIHGHIFRKKG